MNNLIGISGHMQAGKDEIGKIIQYLTSGYSDITEDYYFSYDEYLRIQNTVSAILEKYEIKKFADKLKDIVRLLIGCTRKELEDRNFKEKELGKEWDCWSYEDCGNFMNFKSHKDTPSFPDLLSIEKIPNMINGYERKMTPRLLLQLLGTECGRQILHPNIWVNALFADYNRLWYENGEEVIKHPSWIITDVRFPNEVKAIKDRNGIVIRIERPCPICHQIFYHKMSCGNGPTHESEVALDDYKDFDYTIINDGTIEDLVEKVKNIFKNESGTR